MTNKVLLLEADEQPCLGILSDLIGYNLHRAEIASYRYFIQTLHPKTTPKQFSVLILVETNPGISQVDLGNQLGMDRATTMAVIDKLHNRKLLQRNKSSVDRRKHELNLTKSGKLVLRRLKRDIQTHENQLTKHLTGKDKKLLNNLLKQIRENLE